MEHKAKSRGSQNTGVAGDYAQLTCLLRDIALGSDRFLWNGHSTLQANSLNDKGGIGVVLAGSSYIFEKMNGRNEMLYAQIISRIGMRKHLFGNIPKDDIEAILKEEDLDVKHLSMAHKMQSGQY